MNMPRSTTGSGIKAFQRGDTDDRCLIYRQMRRTLHKDTPFTSDVDQIEWVRTAGGWRAAAVLELTQRLQVENGVDYGPTPPSSYFDRLLHRYEQEGAQAELACTLARALGCSAYVVVFNDDATILWVYSLSKPGGWRRMDRVLYERFLFHLKDRTLANSATDTQ